MLVEVAVMAFVTLEIILMLDYVYLDILFKMVAIGLITTFFTYPKLHMYIT